MKIKVKNSGIVNLSAHQDTRRGDLFVGEALDHIPFPIKRFFIIKNGAIKRGEHAHKKNKQAIFCLNGSFKLHMNDGSKKQTVKLDNPSVGVILGTNLWHTMSSFSKDCVILVAASHRFDENDYIRSYKQFMETTRKTQLS